MSLRAPVLVFAPSSGSPAPLGATVRLRGQLAPADEADLAALLFTHVDAEVLSPPDVWWRGAERVRSSLRTSVAHRPADQRALVPALVDGDDAGLPPALEADFKATGLTHLLAVSGTNLTLLVGFVLALARWCRVRGRWLAIVGAAGIIGFVLLARTEPSVLRAAVMGTVALLGLGHDGRQRGLRALGVAVLVLVLVDPRLAVTRRVRPVRARDRGDPRARAGNARRPGPVAATLVGRGDRRPPRGAAGVHAGGRGHLRAGEPGGGRDQRARGPSSGTGHGPRPRRGLLGLVCDPVGRLAGTLASWCVAWIIVVAERGAALPVAAIEWGTGAVSLAVLTVLVAALALAAPPLLRRPATGVACCLVLVVAVLVRPADLGWPPDGWVLVACDVGQGDALVLNAGPGAAVVVDAGPDPVAVDQCLDRLDVHQVPLLVLTHFHADHVGGVAGVAPRPRRRGGVGHPGARPAAGRG